MVKLAQQNKRISDVETEQFEAALGTRLPDDFRAFLLDCNGGHPEPNRAVVLPPTNLVGIRLFYGILGEPGHGDLVHARNAMINRLPPGFLSIAEDDCGNLVCLSLGSGGFGCVFFWDHEREAEDFKPATLSNLFKIGNSFHELFESLKTPVPVFLREGQVKRVWVDPDFLAGAE